ncbi:interferon alpha/beta receptor 1 [Indicator indicator]|uniref:interferon alpha/beta receptor 1 n=1 Tax=Indicator indicator TaxID=1002788 RepID=UPI0023DFCD43|nr:interferon alpha/beta receptor 1 [Indicator indicator]
MTRQQGQHNGTEWECCDNIVSELHNHQPLPWKAAVVPGLKEPSICPTNTGSPGRSGNNISLHYSVSYTLLCDGEHTQPCLRLINDSLRTPFTQPGGAAYPFRPGTGPATHGHTSRPAQPAPSAQAPAQPLTATPPDRRSLPLPPRHQPSRSRPHLPTGAACPFRPGTGPAAHGHTSRPAQPARSAQQAPPHTLRGQSRLQESSPPTFCVPLNPAAHASRIPITGRAARRLRAQPPEASGNGAGAGAEGRMDGGLATVVVGRAAVAASFFCFLVSLPLHCAGQTNLKSPQDIQVYVVNTNFTLRWNYTGNDTNVTFLAEYQWFEDFKTNGTEWKELPGCQNVTSRECDFSSAITKYYDTYHVRIRAKRREEVSPWSSIFEMIPYLIAQIGPPDIKLQSTNGAIKIKVSPPEANQVRKMWTDHLSFKYNVIIWKNSSNAEFRSQSIFPTDTINDLAPDTTYCLKVQATLALEWKEGLFSPIRCVKTTHKVNDLHCAKNVTILALNMEFYLHWNNQYKQHVSYNVQYLIGYLKKLHDDYSSKWLNVPGCENITDTQCNLSSIITATSGFYYFHVQAMNEYNKSCLSNEVKVDPLITNEIGPPDVKVDVSDVLLHIQISPPGGAQSEVMRDHYDLSYRVLYWKNSSNNEEEIKMKEIKQTIGTVSDLTPATLYCVKVQAFSEAYNKSSPYSKEECIKTPGGKILPLIILTTFFIALIAVSLVATLLVFTVYQVYNKIKYVFFPSCQPPLNIEGFEQPFRSLYLPATEEQIENCSVIELIITEANQVDFKDYKHSKQSSRDSGNYSNDDDISGHKVSEETLEKEIG